VFFTAIGREIHTFGKIYIIRCPNDKPWVGQSIALLAEALNNTGTKVFASSLYRIVRGVQKRTESVTVRVVSLDELNREIHDGCYVVSRSPGRWLVSSKWRR
jgi:hypothetical protein